MSDEQSKVVEAKVVEVADGNTTPVVRPSPDHESPKTKPTNFFSALVGGAMLVSSHVIAMCLSLVLLVAVPLVLFVVVFVVLFIIAATTQRDLGSPVFFPAGIVFILIFGLSSAAITAVVNILLDTVRRLLHWPFWIPPVGVAAVSYVALTAYSLVHDKQSILLGLRNALLPMLALTAIFCVYWVPLTFTGAVLRLLQWTSKKTWRAFREKRAAQKAKRLAP